MTKHRATRVPAIPAPSGAPGSDTAFAEAVKEALEVGLGQRGDWRDAFVRYRDLNNSGAFSITFQGAGGNGGRPGIGGDGGTGIFLNPIGVGQTPLPTGHLNVRTSAIWDGIMIKWDWPPGTIEYAYTEVWGAKQILGNPVPVFGNAVLIGNSSGNSFAHLNLGLGAVWYYWLRYVGFAVNGGPPPVSLYTPSQSGQGVRGETAIDPTYVLGVLADQIGEDQLAIGLAERIDLVDFYYDSTGTKVPVPRVPLFNADGTPTGVTVNNVENRVLVAIRDVNGTFQAAIAQEASIRVRDDNAIIGAYSVRVDIGGYVAGFGLVAIRLPNGDLQGPPENNQFESAFVVRADRFAVVRPRQPGEPTNLPEIVPFVVGLVNGISTVGINGQLVVDGTITARHIQAGSIGTSVLNANEVWAAVVNADRVFASSFATSGDTNWRVMIGGQNEEYPFWYGRDARGGPNSVFYFDRNGNTYLAGNLTVTGAGRFSTANGGANDSRVEIGGSGDQFVFWVGAGPRTAANSVFHITRNGTPYIRGAPIVLPVGSRSGSGQPSCSLVVQPVAGQATMKVFVQGIASVGLFNPNGSAAGLYEKTVVSQFLANGAPVDQFISSTQDYSYSEHQISVLNLPAGSYTFTMTVAITAVGGGHQLPTVQYFGGSMIALQLASVSL